MTDLTETLNRLYWAGPDVEQLRRDFVDAHARAMASSNAGLTPAEYDKIRDAWHAAADRLVEALDE